MDAMSNYLEAAVLNSVLNAAAFPSIPTIYVALYTAAPSDTGGGTEVSTVGTNYARASVVAGFSTDDLDTRFSNTAAIFYLAASASWGTITHVGLHTALTGGNLLIHGALSASRTIGIGDQLAFAIDALGITLS